MKVTKQALASGAVLRELIRRYRENSTSENLANVLYCLRDSDVYIPANVIKNDNNGSEVSLQYPLLRSGEAYYFPVFTSISEMSESYQDSFTKIRRSFLEAIEIANSYGDELEAIVVDGFSAPFEVGNDLYQLITSLESTITE